MFTQVVYFLGFFSAKGPQMLVSHSLLFWNDLKISHSYNKIVLTHVTHLKLWQLF